MNESIRRMTTHDPRDVRCICDRCHAARVEMWLSPAFLTWLVAVGTRAAALRALDLHDLR